MNNIDILERLRNYMNPIVKSNSYALSFTEEN